MYVRVSVCVAKIENVVEMWIECSNLCVKFWVIITFCSDNPGHGLPLVWRDINTKSEILPILTLMEIQTNKNVSPKPQFLVCLEISSFALLIDAKSLYQNSSLPWSKSGGAQTCPETRNCRITERISLQTFSHSLNSTYISHLTFHAPNKPYISLRDWRRREVVILPKIAKENPGRKSGKRGGKGAGPPNMSNYMQYDNPLPKLSTD